jgi:hypothetical protein
LILERGNPFESPKVFVCSATYAASELGGGVTGLFANGENGFCWPDGPMKKPHQLALCGFKIGGLNRPSPA